VRLIPAQFVKPYRKSNKKDFLDADAIAEAVAKQNMRFAELKTVEQLERQAMHQVRDRLAQRRTALLNEIRGFLLERGIPLAGQGVHLRKNLPAVIEDAGQNLSPRLGWLLHRMWQEWKQMETDGPAITAEIERIRNDDARCRQLRQIPGFGPLISTATVAAIGNGVAFRRGRDFAAWVGVGPIHLPGLFLRQLQPSRNAVADHTFFGSLGTGLHFLQFRSREQILVKSSSHLARLWLGRRLTLKTSRPTIRWVKP